METPSKEAAQMHASTTSKQGLGREVQAALFRVKIRPECLQRTSGTQKSSPLSSKGGRKKYKRQKERQKR